MNKNNITHLKNKLAGLVCLFTVFGCSTHTAQSNNKNINKGGESASLASVKTSNTLLESASLFASLPDYCPTPDAFAVSPSGELTLSCVNYANKGLQAGVLVNINNDKTFTKIAQLSGPNNKGKGRPMGLAYAPDGSLFIADNQGAGKARLLKLTLKNNKVINTQIVAKGMSSPNGVRYQNGYIYVTQLRVPSKNKTETLSGIYRFKATDTNILVTNSTDDPHLLFLAKTINKQRKFGLDGLVFDSQGNLFVTNLGDDLIYKLTFDTNNNLLSQSTYATLPKGSGPDGLTIDPQGNLYAAGFLTNQVIKIDTNQNVTVIASYPDNNSENGELDQPADIIYYKGSLLMSNFDLLTGPGIINTGHGKPYTVSEIKLHNK
ncbi:SMP-30/gluconolactonase/LRE family protein [Pseudoalteromonas sp. Z9A5]|uniref:Vgb family protein n=1 Tax=Pseudoalteromonas sp. Z9A5 TaxID=2686355 RepID=UPI00140D5BB2|nr:SMP-30/gluconolactonase/LRE family protein [Pseudoalteromonas sp. Z9A5]